MRRDGWPPPKKSLGQVMLVDADLAFELVERLDLQPGDRVLEIGPGRGILTDFILKRGAEVVCCEIDRRMTKILRKRFGNNNRFRVIEQDILELEIASLFSGDNYQAVGNLPYHLTSGIIFKFYEHVRSHWDDGKTPPVTRLSVMVQKEVADRILSQPGDSEWGILSVFADLHCLRERILEVPPDAFRPRPKVRSTVIRLNFRQNYPLKIYNFKRFDNIIRKAFEQRRKMMRNTLADYRFPPELSAELTKRPQEMSIADFARLAETAERD